MVTSWVKIVECLHESIVASRLPSAPDPTIIVMSEGLCNNSTCLLCIGSGNSRCKQAVSPPMDHSISAHLTKQPSGPLCRFNNQKTDHQVTWSKHPEMAVNCAFPAAAGLIGSVTSADLKMHLHNFDQHDIIYPIERAQREKGEQKSRFLPEASCQRKIHTHSARAMVRM